MGVEPAEAGGGQKGCVGGLAGCPTLDQGRRGQLGVGPAGGGGAAGGWPAGPQPLNP